jgi:glycerophosphoryl diester phosphodiesterase
MNPISVPPDFRLIAHRGASAYAPENTRPAFELARHMGVYEVDLDTQLSADGVVVICHDQTLERYGHGDRPVESLTAAELLSLDMGAWFSPHFFTGTPMMSLDQLLVEFTDTFVYHIELKGRAEKLPDAVYKTVVEQNLEDNVIFTSFSYEHLERMKHIAPDCKLAWLVDAFDQQTLERALPLDLFQLCPRAAQVNSETVTIGRTVATEIRAWSLAGPPQEVRQLIHHVIESGCDGMTPDWPDWAGRG